MTIIGVPVGGVLTTRQDIEDEIASILNRSDLTASIPRWLFKSHRRIQRLIDYKTQEYTEIVATVSQADGVAGVSKYTISGVLLKMKKPLLLYTWDPTQDRLLRFYNKTSMSQLRLRRKENDAINSDVMIADPLTFVREFDTNLFAIWRGAVEFWPGVSQQMVGQEFRMDFLGWLDLPQPQQEDWFTINARDYLVYRSLMESAPFLVDDPRVGVWKSFSDDAERTILGAEIDNVVSGELVMRG